MHTDTSKNNKQIDWQGHRGARGLLPENTIPSFLKALEYDIQTLELDVAVSKDNKIIISHEPWFSHHICSKANGNPVLEDEEKNLRIYEMTYEKIKAFDCGSRGNERFEEQRPMKLHKPSFKDMVQAVDTHCKKTGRALPNFNVEIKSQPDYYGVFSPEPREFVQLMLDEINELNIKDRVNLQSFDFNILREIKAKDNNISMAMLIENTKSVAANLKDLGFTPPIYSPYYKLLDETVIKEIHDKGMRVIPWTVNETMQMKRLIKQGVDGIITDYPDRIPK